MSAILSPCGQFRYLLVRSLHDDPATPIRNPVVFVMLNPSTADAVLDDATIRKCKAFAREWGHDGIIVMNAYAFRATDPKVLRDEDYPIGEENDEYLAETIRFNRKVICAWGNNIQPTRQVEVLELLRTVGADLYHLGLNDNGTPKHPLYRPNVTLPTPWAEQAEPQREAA